MHMHSPAEEHTRDAPCARTRASCSSGREMGCAAADAAVYLCTLGGRSHSLSRMLSDALGYSEYCFRDGHSSCCDVFIEELHWPQGRCFNTVLTTRCLRLRMEFGKAFIKIKEDQR
eukprot:365688-Chlamydomonas_euryale.AAC.12